VLEPLVARLSAKGPVRYSPHVVVRRPDFFRQARKLHLEGIVSKRSAASYRYRRADTPDPPFASVPRSYQRGARLAEPRRVIEVAFTSWTTDGVLRDPSFEGIREDKPARDVKLERPRQSTQSGRLAKLVR